MDAKERLKTKTIEDLNIIIKNALEDSITSDPTEHRHCMETAQLANQILMSRNYFDDPGKGYTQDVWVHAHRSWIKFDVGTGTIKCERCGNFVMAEPPAMIRIDNFFGDFATKHWVCEEPKPQEDKTHRTGAYR